MRVDKAQQLRSGQPAGVDRPGNAAGGVHDGGLHAAMNAASAIRKQIKTISTAQSGPEASPASRRLFSRPRHRSSRAAVSGGERCCSAQPQIAAPGLVCMEHCCSSMSPMHVAYIAVYHGPPVKSKGEQLAEAPILHGAKQCSPRRPAAAVLGGAADDGLAARLAISRSSAAVEAAYHIAATPSKVLPAALAPSLSPVALARFIHAAITAPGAIEGASAGTRALAASL